LRILGIRVTELVPTEDDLDQARGCLEFFAWCCLILMAGFALLFVCPALILVVLTVSLLVPGLRRKLPGASTAWWCLLATVGAVVGGWFLTRHHVRFTDGWRGLFFLSEGRRSGTEGFDTFAMVLGNIDLLIGLTLGPLAIALSVFCLLTGRLPGQRD
jgi:hypothetical protein